MADSVVRRVQEHLEKHRAWLQQQHAALEQLMTRLEEDDALTEAVAVADESGVALFSLMQEQGALLVEWETARPEDTERDAIRANAAEVAQLTEAVVALQNALLIAIAERLVHVGDATQDLLHARGNVLKYRPTLDTTAGFLDRDG